MTPEIFKTNNTAWLTPEERMQVNRKAEQRTLDVQREKQITSLITPYLKKKLTVPFEKFASLQDERIASILASGNPLGDMRSLIDGTLTDYRYDDSKTKRIERTLEALYDAITSGVDDFMYNLPENYTLQSLSGDLLSGIEELLDGRKYNLGYVTEYWYFMAYACIREIEVSSKRSTKNEK